MMEQEKKKGPGVLWLAVLGAAVCLTMSLSGHRTEAVAASAPTQLSGLARTAGTARKVIPLGKAVGIKLFSDGVLVVGLSPVETEDGASYPGRD